jgi:YVTN family beta-propeller protein
MNTPKWAARTGAATFAVGLGLALGSGEGVASADPAAATSNASTPSSSTGQSISSRGAGSKPESGTRERSESSESADADHTGVDVGEKNGATDTESTNTDAAEDSDSGADDSLTGETGQQDDADGDATGETDADDSLTGETGQQDDADGDATGEIDADGSDAGETGQQGDADGDATGEIDAGTDETGQQDSTEEPESTEPKSYGDKDADDRPSRGETDALSGQAPAASESRDVRYGDDASTSVAPHPGTDHLSASSVQAATDFLSEPEESASVTPPAPSEVIVDSVSPSDPITSLITNVLRAVFSPLVPHAQGNPVGGVWETFMQYLFLARREVDHLFFNKPPTVGDVQIAQTGEVITGTLGADDPEGDPLTYTVTRPPAHGTVVIDSEGVYTYTPNGDVLVDTFEVSVSDATPFENALNRVLTLGGLLDDVFGLSASHTTTTTVIVAGAPQNVGAIEVGHIPSDVGLSADGKVAYVTNSGDNSLTVIDTTTQRVIATIDDIGNYPVAVAAGSDRVYVANMFDDTVSVIDTTTNKQIMTYAVGDQPIDLALSADGGQLYVVNAGAGTVSVIDVADGTAEATFEVGRDPNTLAINHIDGRLYVTNATDGTVSVIEPTTGVVHTVELGAKTAGVAVAADGKWVYVTGNETGVVWKIDATDYSVIDTIEVGGSPGAITVSADGARAYAVNGGGVVSVIDTAAGTAIGTIDVLESAPSVAISPDGTRLFTTNAVGGTLTVNSLNPASVSLGSNKVLEYEVVNLSGKPLRFERYAKGIEALYGPQRGTVIQPGESFRFAVGTGSVVQPEFVVVGGQGTSNVAVTAVLTNVFGGAPLADCSSGNSTAVGCKGIYSGTVTALVVSGQKGSVVEVPASNAVLQAQIINAVCSEKSNCRFRATRQELTYSPSHIVGDVVINDSPLEQIYSVSIADQQSQTDSISVAVKVGGSVKFAVKAIEATVNTEITTTYGHTWTKTYTFTRTETIKIPPYNSGTISAVQPVYRVHGDFTVNFDGRTFILRDVYFDTPNPNGTGYVTYSTKPLTPPEVV